MEEPEWINNIIEFVKQSKLLTTVSISRNKLLFLATSPNQEQA